MDLIVTKWIAMEGAAILARDKGEELRAHFPRALADRAEELGRAVSIEKEMGAAGRFGAADMEPLGEGGIFTALWKLAERMRTGLEADLRKIPVKQEIIEICEYFDLNPYNMLSGGSLLIAVPNGLAMAGELEKLGVSSAIIGRTTDGNDRTIRNQEHIRYLDRPQREELYQIYKEGWKRL